MTFLQAPTLKVLSQEYRPEHQDFNQAFKRHLKSSHSIWVLSLAMTINLHSVNMYLSNRSLVITT